MSIYSRSLNHRVTKVEAQIEAAQNVDDATYPSVIQEVIAEAERVLQPCMWGWILETTEHPQQRDLISLIAKILAFHQGWELLEGWGEGRRYWWAPKGMGSFVRSDHFNPAGLFYFFGCSRAEFDSLPERVRNEAWDEAVRRVTSVLRDHKTCEFHMYRPDDVPLLVAALSQCNLPELLTVHLRARKGKADGSKEAFVVWLNAEYRRQHAKRGIIK